ncbi:MAG: acyl carrier protein [Myxococcales bacterium]|nr:acyl carrier protein [Myxococcales bacterium]MCB9748856.1 acyl carrier protein [Myxococcales bacterium]
MVSGTPPDAQNAIPDSLVRELKELIIEALMLNDMTPDEIDSSAPLLAEGLGLDSIDVLELAMALNKRYGVKTQADDERNREIFASVDNLARFIAEQQRLGLANA